MAIADAFVQPVLGPKGFTERRQAGTIKSEPSNYKTYRTQAAYIRSLLSAGSEDDLLDAIIDRANRMDAEDTVWQDQLKREWESEAKTRYQPTPETETDEPLWPGMETDDPFAKFRRDRAEQWAKEEFDKARKDWKRHAIGLKADFERAFRAGAPSMIVDDVALSDEQRQGIRDNTGWQMTPQQARHQAIREAPSVEEQLALFEDDPEANKVLADEEQHRRFLAKSGVDPEQAELLARGARRGGPSSESYAESQRRLRELETAKQMGHPEVRHGLIGQTMEALTMPGGVASGAVEGLRKQALTETEGMDVEDPGEAVFDLARDLPDAKDAYDKLRKVNNELYRKIPVVGSLFEGFGLLPEDPDAQIVIGEDTAENMKRRLMLPVHAAKGMFGGGWRDFFKGIVGESWGGVPTDALLDKIDEDPTVLQSLLGAAVTGAGAAPFSARERGELVRKNIRTALDRYREQADKEALEAMSSSAPPEAVKAMADDLYRRYVEADDRLTFDPAATQLIQETALDPTMVAPSLHPLAVAGRGAKAASKGAGRIAAKAIEAGLPLAESESRLARAAGGAARTADVARETIGAIKDAVSYRPETYTLGGVAEDLGASLRAAEGKAAASSRIALDEIADINLAISKAVKSPEERALLFAARENPELAAGLPPHLRPHLDAIGEMADKLHDLRLEHGLGQRYSSSGELLPAAKREGYIPYLVVEEADPTAAQKAMVKATEYLRKTGRITRTRPMGSAFRRSGKGVPVLDPIAQFDAEISAMRRHLPKAMELGDIKAVAQDAGALEELPLHEAASHEEAVSRASRKLEKSRGALEKVRQKHQAAEILAEEHAQRASALKNRLRGQRGTNIGTVRPTTEALRRRINADLVRSRKMVNDAQKAVDKWEAEEIFERGHLEVATKSQEELAERLETLNRTTATKWAVLDTTNDYRLKMGAEPPGAEFRRLTGKPGSFKGQTVQIVPEAVAKRINALTMADVPRTGGLALWDQFMRNVISPTNRVWRLTHTMLSVPYFAKNALGAFGLSTVALGAKALDPRHQLQAAELALLSSGVFPESALAAPIRLRGGQQSTFGEIIDVAKKWGVTDVSDLRLGLERTASKGAMRPVGKAEDAVFRRVLGIPGTEKASLANVNRVIENYQKLVAFTGFLENTKSYQSIAKAADLTAKFAGDYRRLGWLEKDVFREGFGFYAWSRYIVPHITRQVFENPARLAQWVRLRDYAWNKWGDEIGMFREGLPGYASNLGIPSPIQPEPESEADYRRAVVQLESPDAMGFGMFANDDTRIGEFLGVWGKLATEVMTRRDVRTGRELKGFFPQTQLEVMNEWEKFGTRESPEFIVPRMLMSMVDRPTQAYANIVQMFKNYGPRGSDVDLALRYRAGRDMFFLDRLAAPLLEQAGMAPVSPEVSPLSYFGSTYLVDPTREVRGVNRTFAE